MYMVKEIWKNQIFGSTHMKMLFKFLDNYQKLYQWYILKDMKKDQVK